ncbi:hypothetical protein D3C87_1873080 [compost metagenome]
MDIMPVQTSKTLIAMATNVGCAVEAKKAINAPLTMSVTIKAAERTYIRQKMQEMTVMAM